MHKIEFAFLLTEFTAWMVISSHRLSQFLLSLCDWFRHWGSELVTIRIATQINWKWLTGTLCLAMFLFSE